MKKSIFLLSLAAAYLSGCGHKSEYTEQINQYINNTNYCVNIPFSPYSWAANEMPNDTISITVPSPITNIGEEKLSKYNDEVKQLDTLAKLGILIKGKADKAHSDFFKEDTIRNSYSVTKYGLEQFGKDNSGKPVFGKLCIGQIEVTKIHDPETITFTVMNNDVKGEEVKYDSVLKLTSKYAENSEFQSVFGVSTKGTNSVFFSTNDQGKLVGFPMENNQINLFKTLQTPNGSLF